MSSPKRENGLSFIIGVSSPSGPLPIRVFSGQRAPLIGSWPQAPQAALLLFVSVASDAAAPSGASRPPEDRDGHGPKPMEEDMRVFMLKLLLRFSRVPLRLHFRVSITTSDVPTERIVRRKALAILLRVRWTLAICRAPPV